MARDVLPPKGVIAPDLTDDASAEARTEPDIVPAELEQSRSAMPGPEELIGDTYQVTGVIGEGAMGVVYLAVDMRLGRPVALKLIRGHLAAPGFRVLFREEARAMALVNHPNVVTIYSFGDHLGAPYLAMELVEGTSLDKMLEAQTKAVPFDLALALLDQACLGLSAIHEAGTVHRDIKPSNLFVDRQQRLRIGDLGLATSYKDGTARREIVGTPGYIAPEIILGQGDATPESDVYSLACVAYELLTGLPPFYPTPGEELGMQHLVRKIPPPSQVRPELPATFDRPIMAALVEDPQRRTGTAERFRQMLLDSHTATLDPARILIVDDDADTRSVLQAVLEAEFPSAEIECAADGDAALAACLQRPPSVVVSDLQMPGTDGIALTISLRSRGGTDAIPIVLLTASGTPEDWRRLSTLGAAGFLVKPANVEDLANTIRRAVRERRERANS